MPKILLYHGTAHDFDAFDDRFRQRGVEPNSCLGIHLTQVPGIAADYAESATRDGGAVEARVLIVEVEVEKVALVISSSDFMGRSADDDFETTRLSVDFVDAREWLIQEGYDSIAVDAANDDLAGAWVIMHPERLKIVGRMSLDEAYAVEEIEDFPNIDYEVVQLFEHLDSFAP